jgi:hypothetical protein
MKLVLRALSMLWYRVITLFGWPMPPSEEQKEEKLVTMREKRDCHVPVIANTCGVSYEKAHKAAWHADLPFFFESPLISNPRNVCRAIRSLGFGADDSITWAQIKSCKLPVGKLIILVHEPSSDVKGTLVQHWVTLEEYRADGYFGLHWGKKQELVYKSESDLLALFKSGIPACAILVKDKAN